MRPGGSSGFLLSCTVRWCSVGRGFRCWCAGTAAAEFPAAETEDAVAVVVVMAIQSHEAAGTIRIQQDRAASSKSEKSQPKGSSRIPMEPALASFAARPEGLVRLGFSFS